MGRQRNLSHMKKQNKAPEKELNERETSNLPDTEIKTLVIRMLNKLRRRVDELSEDFNKEIENIKIERENIIGSQSENKNTIYEMKSTLEGVNRLEEAE